ncbi:FILIA-N KH-like domain-containing protein isoform X2 [Phyllopteryx taeniolatus]|uniref:FILIA-N KH-like domain-containing protein isoform X2 n=1 Tax=Phyllopteryx taeniolatus TaxID=161469 RepID=UPI002AD52F61|nr:FILIA-N KH-like domain-containing protein isoform X2 [Phyllopteryx taeniolatus]
MELLEVESSVVVITALGLLLAAAVLLRRRREEAAASVGSPAAACARDEPSTRRLAAPRQAVPQPEAVSVDPEPGQESKSCTGTASAPEDNLVEPICGSEPVSEAVSVSDPLLEPSMRPIISELFPNTVNELCFVKETLSLALTSGPETAPQPEAIAKKPPVPVPETIPQLEPVHETLVAPEPFPETIPVPEPVHETLVAPEAVPETLNQLESAIEKCYALEQVSKSTVEPVLEQLSETEPTSEQELEAVVLVSEPLSVAQVIPEELWSSKPVSDLQPESEPKEFLQVVAERLFGPADESVFAALPRSDREKPPTPEPVAERAADDAVPQADLQPEPEPQPELNGCNRSSWRLSSCS